MTQRTEAGAEDDRQSRLPQVEPGIRDGDDADEYRGELEIWRQPDGEQIDRLAVSFLERYVLDATRFDGGDPLPVLALPDRNVPLYFVNRLHWPSPYTNRP